MSTAAVIYLRISEDRTGQEAGVTRQREDCERRCRERGWSVVAVEKDNDTSAAGGKRRPGFENVIRAVESGEAKVVVAWALDRLQRSKRDELRLYEACERHKAIVSLVRGPDLEWETPTGRFLADQLGATCRYEIEQKSDRQKRAQLQAARNGRRVGGRRPFGYEQDGMTIREDEAKLVYSGYQDLLMGASLGELARDWNGKGFSTGQGNEWTRASVRDVLLNPRNAGLRAHVTEDDRKAANGGRVYAHDNIIGKAAWPPIVDESTWRAAHDVLTDPKRRRSPSNERSLLTGIACCAECGLTVHSGGAAVSSGQMRVYRCRSMRHVSRNADPVDDYIGMVVVERLSAPDARDLLIDTDRPDAGKLREEAVVLRTRLDGLAVDYADGILTREQVRVASDRLRGRLAEVETLMADTGRVDVLGALVAAGDVSAAWEGLTTHQRRKVVEILMDVRLHSPGRGTRTFRPQTVEITWRT